MGEFRIRFRSFQDMQEFVTLATRQPFQVFVNNGSEAILATSLMALVGLDHSRPILVTSYCSDGTFEEFRRQAARFAAD